MGKRRHLSLLVAAGIAVAATTALAQPQTYGNIDRGRLLSADKEPGSWLTTGRDFGKTHYSPLKEINRDTVKTLGFSWEYRTFTNQGLEASPIVVDGILYTSGVEGRAYALDAKTGKEIWTFDPEVDGQIHRDACCGGSNRGVAVWKGKVYVGALDGRLFALDAKTGKVLWQTDTVVDHKRAYTITGAPEIAGNVVVIGNGGAEYDARGYVSAYDLDTGKLKWRFYVVPGDPKKGFEHPELAMAAKTWDPNSRWEFGLGGTPWDALVYDPELNLLYVGTGNAALYPRYVRSPSGGDNLFLTSILAINPDTGRLKWYYQEVPGDQWDYTATMPIILADLTIDGRKRKVLMQAPKDGFFYVLDRETGEFISARNFVPQNWAKSIDPKTGKATVNDDLVRYGFDKVKLVYPSPAGGHSWQPMAYSPDTGLVYIPALERGEFMVDVTKNHVYRPRLRNDGVSYLRPDGKPFLGTAVPESVSQTVRSGKLLKDFDPTVRSFLRAWNPVTQTKAWDFETTQKCGRTGVLATAGGLLIMGGLNEGTLCILDDRTGKLLREIEVGSSIEAAPVTYTVDGEQYIAVMAAVGGFSSYAPPPGTAAYKYGNDGRILAFKLGGGPTPLPSPLADPSPIPKPPVLKATTAEIERGSDLFNSNCSVCHQNTNSQGSVPDLRRMTPEKQAAFKDIVLHGLLRSRGMPQWDDVFSEADVNAIHAYVLSLAWKGYREQEAGKGVDSSVSRQNQIVH